MARKTNNRKKNPTYLILVEGQTELIYFQNLKETCMSDGFTVICKQANHSNPVLLINEAFKKSESSVYDNIWCVYDCDVLHGNTENFEGVYQAALKQGIHFAESMPCIEVWFMLHFAQPRNYYQNADAVVVDLKKHIPQYGKNQEWQRRNLFKVLQERTKTALTNASRLPPLDHDNQNTATSVPELVKIFKEDS
jgi:hypothetical protein